MKLKRFFLFVLFAGLQILFIPGLAAGQQSEKLKGMKKHIIEIKGDWIYVNGERFFIKGIGYSPAYPGQLPWKRPFNEESMRRDFQMIREAGFNALRTWLPLRPEEIDLAREYDLFVLQGVWINYTGNFASERSMMKTVNKFYQEVEKTRDKDNILVYLLGNEPLPNQLFAVGLEQTEEFFLELKKAIKKEIPEIRVSIANWVQSDFLDTRLWDMVCINLYPYYPESVSHSLGYYGYTDWVKRGQALNKPLILTELGLSVSVGRKGAKGYGGNSLKEQNNGLVSAYGQAVDAGANGVCIFEWIDEWWKNFDHGEDQLSQEENDPEEWFGIAYFDRKKNKLITRPVYDALSEFNRAIIINPKGHSKHAQDLDIEVYVNEDVDVVEYKVGRSSWKRMKRKSFHWMIAPLSVSKLKTSDHKLEIRAWKRVKKGEGSLKKTHKIVCKKRKIFTVDTKGTLKPPFRLTLGSESDVCYTKGTMTTCSVTAKVTDSQGNPVADKHIMYSISEPLASQALRSKKKTNKNGEAQIVYFVNEPGVISFAAGTEMIIGAESEQIKAGDIRHVKVYYNKVKKHRRLKNGKKEEPAVPPAEEKKPEVKAEEKAQEKPEEEVKAEKEAAVTEEEPAVLPADKEKAEKKEDKPASEEAPPAEEKKPEVKAEEKAQEKPEEKVKAEKEAAVTEKEPVELPADKEKAEKKEDQAASEEALPAEEKKPEVKAEEKVQEKPEEEVKTKIPIMQKESDGVQ